MQVRRVAGDLPRRRRQGHRDHGEHEPERPRRHDVPRQDEHRRAHRTGQQAGRRRDDEGVVGDREQQREVHDEPRHEVQVARVGVEEARHRPEGQVLTEEQPAVLGPHGAAGDRTEADPRAHGGEHAHEHHGRHRGECRPPAPRRVSHRPRR
ncbi:hypothetical protein [Curtobacterium sp. MCPF17_052]|uniref:hypothetical protein n=1 Tax=Curtobacterium sp. MCPF17_052 TaxID=2175655 RepID=UPI0024DFCDD3|nr:hypothetical protein [Curtobacterium sp. MCPF17_052]WIB13002.1 hypothetical protein DEJ36_03135 [Curtobacterium sp. MCPF17_052]